MKRSLFLSALAFVALATSAFAQPKYIFHRQTNSPRLDSGQVALVYFKQQMMHNGDTVDGRIMSNAVPVRIGPAQDLVMGALLKMGVGDSLSMICTAAEFFGPEATGQMPPDAQLLFHLGVVNAMTPEAYKTFQAEQTQKALMAEENAIKDYLAQQGITDAQRTESGMYYVITQLGRGPKATKGDNLEVHYTGTLLDGSKFDSSVDRNTPFNFPVGMGRVIAGWDEVFQLLPQGSRATIILPSKLAYGERGAGGQIKPNSILRFDVEFISNNGQ